MAIEMAADECLPLFVCCWHQVVSGFSRIGICLPYFVQVLIKSEFRFVVFIASSLRIGTIRLIN